MLVTFGCRVSARRDGAWRKGVLLNCSLSPVSKVNDLPNGDDGVDRSRESTELRQESALITPADIDTLPIGGGLSWQATVTAIAAEDVVTEECAQPCRPAVMPIRRRPASPLTDLGEGLKRRYRHFSLPPGAEDDFQQSPMQQYRVLEGTADPHGGGALPHPLPDEEEFGPHKDNLSIYLDCIQLPMSRKEQMQECRRRTERYERSAKMRKFREHWDSACAVVQQEEAARNARHAVDADIANAEDLARVEAAVAAAPAEDSTLGGDNDASDAS